MADIDKITASDGTTYNIKDSTARESVSRSIPQESSTNGDADSYTTAGVFFVRNAYSNLPNVNKPGGILIVGRANSSTLVQFLIRNTDTTPFLFIRHTSSGSWSEWTEIV